MAKNVPSKPLSCYGIHGFNESRSCIYIQLYKITSKYFIKTYFNGPDRALTHVLLLMCLRP